MYIHFQVATFFLYYHNIIYTWYMCPAVEVNFNEDSYTVAESDGQVSVSLRINGQYFVPVWAVVEIIDGTATGRLHINTYNIICKWLISVHVYTSISLKCTLINS